MGSDDQELALKLLAEHHLSVAEREGLCGGSIRFSDLVAAAGTALGDTGWFPRRLNPDRDIGDGAVIELREGAFWVHEQHEVGVLRYSPLETTRVANIHEAVRLYIKAIGDAPIDGVPVDWET